MKCMKVDEGDEKGRNTETIMIMNGVEDDFSGNGEQYQLVHHDTGLTMQVNEHGQIPEGWVILDNQSTVDWITNSNLLTNIRVIESTMTVMALPTRWVIWRATV